jgi:tripartite-type tricarboxylate transporter receptor subunit TctC
MNVAVIQTRAGIKFNIVPYSGAGNQLADLMSGVIQIGSGFPAGFLPGVKSGRLKFIAAMAEQRSPQLPDVPATDESNKKGVYGGGWFGAFVVKGTSKEIVDKIAAEMKKTVEKPEISKKINELGYTVVITDSDAFSEKIKKQVADMKALLDTKVFSLE